MNPQDTRPLVVVISPLPLLPLTGGGAARIWGYVHFLRREGFRVGLVTPPHRRAQRDAVMAQCDALWEAGAAPPRAPGRKARARGGGVARVRARVAAWLPRRMKEPIKAWRARREARAQGAPATPVSSLARQRNPRLDALAREIIAAERPRAVIANFAWCARGLDGAPAETLTMLDTHDIQHKRAPAAEAAGHNLDRTRCSPEEELAELCRARVLLAIEGEEYDDLVALCPGREVLLVEHALEVPETPWHAPDGARDVLLVGNLYEPNVIGMNAFIETVWPHVREAVPGARLAVCGKMGRKARGDMAGVAVEGIVPSLDPYYAGAAVVINPVPYGTGLKIKTVEALCRGKAVVATPAGARGLGEDCAALRVCAMGPPMAQAVIELLRNPQHRRALEQAALDFARSRFAPERAYAALLERLRSA